MTECTSVRDALASLGVDDTDDIDLDAFEERWDAAGPLGTTRRCLLTIERSSTDPYAGDERDECWLFESDRQNDGSFLMWAQPDAGRAQGVFLDAATPERVQASLDMFLDSQGWSLSQFVGSAIQNHAPELMPKAFFLRLMERAEQRNPLRLAELDTEALTLAEWLDANYQVVPHR